MEASDDRALGRAGVVGDAALEGTVTTSTSTLTLCYYDEGGVRNVPRTSTGIRWTDGLTQPNPGTTGYIRSSTGVSSSPNLHHFELPRERDWVSTARETRCGLYGQLVHRVVPEEYERPTQLVEEAKGV